MNADTPITQTNFQEIQDAIANAEWVPWQTEKESFGLSWSEENILSEFSRSPKSKISPWYAVVMGDDQKPLSTIAKFSGPDAELNCKMFCRVREMKAALETIKNWELPETGELWTTGGKLSYEAKYGSNGVRDYFKAIAKTVLKSIQK